MPKNHMTPKDESKVILNSLTHGSVDINESILLIKEFLEEKPNAEYSLVIGTDSHEKTTEKDSKTVNLVTAVLVHRRGFGGKYFWKKRSASNIHNLREKIYAETLESLSFALYFVPMLRKFINSNSPSYNLEIHIDVGEYGDTRDMIKEVVGMVTGSGFIAKTKPEAYGASYVADKHT
ncbi:MAG: ribonuclease H-like YkuK family protein [Candidatus Levybacteria bacterium]|nr:ribonuclease H-like YkuK family protein [Candidatus Levybacteria bacterium]